MNPDKQDIAKHIDHTNLNPTVTVDDIVKLCVEAGKYNFASICIPPSYVSLASDVLTGSKVAIGTVIGFPLGYSSDYTKVVEIENAWRDGAKEFDVVMNISMLKSQAFTELSDEISDMVVEAHKRKNAIIKIIIEAAYLNEDEMLKACELVADAGADYIKTSTGFANVRLSNWELAMDVSILKAHINKGSYDLKIKAAGGISDYDGALMMLESGADRIGTSSGIRIVGEAHA